MVVWGAGCSTTSTPADMLLLQIQRRHQIWLGWVYAFGAAEWSAEQVVAVQRVIDGFPFGGDRLREHFAKAWRQTYGGSVESRGEAAARYVRIFAMNGITARIDHDGFIDIAAPDIAKMRVKADAVFAQTEPMSLRWYANHGGAVVPQETSQRIDIRAPSLCARLNTNDFGDAYGDALPGLPGEVAVTLGRNARGDGVLPGVIAM